MILNARWRKRINNGVRLIRSRIQGGGLILFYHRVAQRDIDPFEQCLTEDHFEQQLTWLQSWGTLLSLEELLSLAKANNLPRRSVALTFDDGYLDNTTTVRPMLERLEIPAMFYIASGNFGRPFWWDILATTIFRPEALPEMVPTSLIEANVANSTDRHALVLSLHRFLQPLRPERQQAHLQTIADWAGTEMGEEADRAMTETELVAFANSPVVTIGAHTRGHVALGMHDEAYQREVLQENLMTLERLLDRPVQHMSYPYGLPGQHFTRTTERIAADLGFHSAASTAPDVVNNHSNPFALPRLWVQDWPIERFQREVKLWLGN